MISILSIKPNDFTFDRKKYYNNLALLKDDIMNYIEVITISHNDMMETIINQIGLTPELIGSSPVCYEDDKNVHQLCYASERDKELGVTTPITNPNKISNYLINDVVENTCVFLSSKIGPDRICEPENATIDELVKILYSKFIHIGMLIRADNKSPLREFPYGDHPIEFYNVGEYDENKFKILEFDFISFALCAVIDLQPENNIINKRMTRLVGNEVIYGDVLLIQKLPDAYLDLNYELFNKINVLSFGNIESRILTEDEKKDADKVNGLSVVNNKYCILNDRLTNLTKNYSVTCAYDDCKKPNTDFKQCNNCYRVKYHDSECQKNDWTRHKEECLIKK
jgi:hypothetical protein